MKAGTLNLEFTQRDDYSLQITFNDPTGAAIDYHLFTFTAYIRSQNPNDTPVPFGITTTNLATGILVINLTKDQTIMLPRQCVWELRIAGSTGTETCMLRGAAIVEQKVKV